MGFTYYSNLRNFLNSNPTWGLRFSDVELKAWSYNICVGFCPTHYPAVNEWEPYPTYARCWSQTSTVPASLAIVSTSATSEAVTKYDLGFAGL